MWNTHGVEITVWAPLRWEIISVRCGALYCIGAACCVLLVAPLTTDLDCPAAGSVRRWLDIDVGRGVSVARSGVPEINGAVPWCGCGVAWCALVPCLVVA